MATPMDGRIYVNFPELGGLCWWATDHFEAATEDERRRLDGINRLKEGDFDNGVNGWSKRRFGPATRDNGFTLHVGDKFGLSIDGLAAKENTNGTVSIDLLRPAKTPERIWDFYARRGRISKAEYQHLFQDRE